MSRKKNRCDGVEPVCSQCARSKHECEYSETLSRVDYLGTKVKELEKQLREKEEEIERLSLLNPPRFKPGVDSQAYTLLQAEYLHIRNRFTTIDSLVALLPLQSLFACVNRFSQRAQSCYLPRTLQEFPMIQQEIEHLLDNNRRNARPHPDTLALVFAMLATELQVRQYDMSGEDLRRRSDAYGKPESCHHK